MLEDTVAACWRHRDRSGGLLEGVVLWGAGRAGARRACAGARRDRPDARDRCSVRARALVRFRRADGSAAAARRGEALGRICLGTTPSDARFESGSVHGSRLAVIGFATMAAFQLGHIGPTPADIAAYYRGGERAGAMTFAKTFRELVEVTHFHAFIVGVVYLVLAHLFLATSAPEWVKRAGVIVTFAGLAGDMLRIWLIRYASAAFAYTQVLFWGLEWAGFAALVLYPLREMWFRQNRNDLRPD